MRDCHGGRSHIAQNFLNVLNMLPSPCAQLLIHLTPVYIALIFTSTSTYSSFSSHYSPQFQLSRIQLVLLNFQVLSIPTSLGLCSLILSCIERASFWSIIHLLQNLLENLYKRMFLRLLLHLPEKRLNTCFLISFQVILIYNKFWKPFIRCSGIHRWALKGHTAFKFIFMFCVNVNLYVFLWKVLLTFIRFSKGSMTKNRLRTTLYKSN